MNRPDLCATLLVLQVVFSAGARANAESPLDFATEIRPILSDKCFTCHGPDAAARKADLRLDMRDAAVASGTLVPGDADSSELVVRIESSDPDERMPPPQSKHELTDHEIQLLRRWVAEGAAYEKHWAFRPLPARVPLPAVQQGHWPRDAIDRFVLARLEAEGLAPAPEASRGRWLRRAALDLTGLPPTLEQLAAFEADTRPGAYERAADRLLDDPGFGERLASIWLDAARFADTFGYQADAEMRMTPWRDWVISAFNRNMPYSEFVLQQTAGDLIDGATDETLLATGFNRLHRQTNEGGSVEEEWRVEYVSDRVHTHGLAFLGLTLECARCHDHKYDPLTQREYYQLSAFFDNIEESGLYSYFTKATPTPTLWLWQSDAERKRYEQLLVRIAEAESRLHEAEAAEAEAWKQWQADAKIEPPTPAAHFPFDRIDAGKTPDAAAGVDATTSEDPKLVEGVVGKAIALSGENGVSMPHAGKFGRFDPFTLALWIRPSAFRSHTVVLHRSQSWTDSGSRGYELLLDEGFGEFALVHFRPGNELRVRLKQKLPLNQWTHLAVRYDGSSRADGLQWFVDGQPAETTVVRDLLTRGIEHRAEWGDLSVGSIHLTLGNRFRDVGFRGGQVDEIKIFDKPLSGAEIRLASDRFEAAAEGGDFRFVYLRDHAAAVRTARATLEALRREAGAIADAQKEMMVMRERPEPRTTYLLERGSYEQRGEVVEPGTPESILSFDASLPRNRLGLARWYLHPEHPLTSRVAVNRLWQMLFGTGLVRTSEDFGSQGSPPTHPALLDHLARRYMEGGWDTKRLMRAIVTSATYRQASEVGAERMRRDPENRLLARGPGHRLDAEVLRDQALAAAGLLSRRIGGESVRPYQPPGLWEEKSGGAYVQDHGEKLYRRGLYTYLKRTSPLPSMVNFDATAREVCIARRERTSGPLQALVLLNDPQFIEAARVLAERLVRTHPDDLKARVAAAWQLFTGLSPDASERAILLRLHQRQQAHYASDPSASQAVATVGEWAADKNLDPIDTAATTLLVSTVMNHWLSLGK